MKKLILLVATFLSSMLSQAQVTETPSKLEDALLWEISGNGLQKSSYLLGTMHTVEFNFMFDSIPGIRKVLSAVEQVATEVDMMASDSIRSKAVPMSADYLLMPPDTTYSMLYNAKDFAFVDSVLSSGNARYAKRIPAFWQDIYVTYNVRNSKKMSMDYFVLLSAHQNSKKTFSLETREEVINKKKEANLSKYKASLKEQASKLLFILKNANIIYNALDQVDSLYRAQKLSRLNFEGIIKELTAPYAQVTDVDLENNALLTNYNSIIVKGRNDAWMLKIPVLINQGSTLIAVGVGHLAGDMGLINQLRKMGYTVNPVK